MKPGSRAILTKIYQVSYWVLPAILLVLVFRGVDRDVFERTIGLADLRWVSLGVFALTAMLFSGGLRWWSLLQAYVDGEIPLPYALRRYWIGFALGRFVPGSVGWDVYRIASVAKRYPGFLKNSMTVVIEKAAGVSSAAFLILVLYPSASASLARGESLPAGLWGLSGFVVAMLLLVLGLVLLSHTSGFGTGWARGADRLARAAAAKVSKTVRPLTSITPEEGPTEWVSPLLRWMPAGILLVTSLSVQLLSALGNHFFFIALGQDVPFLVNLFLVPIFFFAFILPISFGGIGVREGMYVFLYGKFGVSAEAALFVSFLNLAALLVNVAIGSLLMYSGTSAGSPDAPAPFADGEE